MKYTLLILFFLLGSVAGATTYYISPNGSDSNSGTSSSPWKTLAYACSQATTPGDIIHVNAGTFIETTQSLLKPGVSIIGEGNSSVILSRVTGTTYGHNTIKLAFTTQGANGDQSISFIKMDGDNTAFGAIVVSGKSNVLIHDCTFVDFENNGVMFTASASNGMPTTWAKGNKFYNNTVTNCSKYVVGVEGRWALGVNGQDGMQIYNNVMTQTSRPAGQNGYIIKGVEGFNKGLKIYKNTMTRAKAVPGSFDFAIEFWNCMGGIEIYDNTLKGSIDLGGRSTTKGSYPYAVYIHNNSIGEAALNSYEATRGVLCESNIHDVIIERNYFNNITTGIFFSQYPTSQTVENVYIRYNIFNNIGSLTSQKGWGVNWTKEAYTNHVVNNINICNNVFNGNSSSAGNMWGIGLPRIGKATNITVRNNIVQGFDYGPTYAEARTGVSIDYLSIENNIFYGNGNNNEPRYASLTPTHNTTQNNIKSNPLFISSSDFHLQSGSPAIGKGLSISGLTADYAGNAVKSPPSIGAYESGSSAAVSGAIPVIQNSIVDNATPSLLSLGYDLSLSSSFIPPVESFVLTVNGTNRTISSVDISSNKVQLSLATAIKYGDVVTLSYTKPATNPIQTTAGGIAAGFSSRAITNNLASLTKDALPVTISMAVTPNHIHKTINVELTYSSTLTAAQISAITPQILRITDTSGKLFIEKVVSAGTTNIKFPLNLYAGIYNVQIFANGVQAATQKIRVY